jgi:protein-S-isoprenylcysteine O-methyltransferase Ste14
VRVAAYVVFAATILYAVGFVSNLVVPKSVDSGPVGPMSMALPIDLALVALFGLQHSVMARQDFKTWWSRIVPESVERSTYVLFSSLALILLFWQWRPIPAAIWSVESQAVAALLYGLALAGWITSGAASMLIDHGSLFGLAEAKETPFRTPGLYKYVRHPIYFGSLLAFWSTPRMTAGHLLFSASMTAYIFIGMFFEERDLVRRFGGSYLEYQKTVPMIVPLLGPPKQKS